MKGIGVGAGTGTGTGKGAGRGRGRDARSGHASENRQTLITFTPEEHHCLCAYFAAQVRIEYEYMLSHVLSYVAMLCYVMSCYAMLCYVMLCYVTLHKIT